MDPLTQGTLGAAAALAVFGRGERRLGPLWIAFAGALGGLAADLDVLIRSAEDPLLAIEYHRHFTHSLAFVPVGGTLAALPWLAWARTRAHFLLLWGASLIGYLTHAPLDACTTYGTLLFWPWSDVRISLSIISIIDPLFTLPLLAAVILTVRRQAPTIARWGLLWGAAYLSLGALQRSRAHEMQETLAAHRGTPIERADLFPSFMNLVAWRSIYESEGYFYVDQVRVPFIGKNAVTPGARLPRPDSPAPLGERSARAYRLMHWFSDNWVARDPGDPSLFGDLRYSFRPYEVTPIWGIRLHQPEDQVEWVNQRSQRAIHLRDLKELIFEDPPGSIFESELL